MSDEKDSGQESSAKLENATKGPKIGLFRSLLNVLKEDTPARNWGGILILFSVILFVIYAWHGPASPDKPSNVISIVGILAGSFLAAGLFSILLGLNEFIGHMTKIVTGLLQKHSYLDTLDPKEKNELRKKIDISLYGKKTVENERGPYKYLLEQYGSIFGKPYRTGFIEDVRLHDECKKTQERRVEFPCKMCVAKFVMPKGYWCSLTTTRYALHFGHMLDLENSNQKKAEDIAIPLLVTRSYYDKVASEAFDSGTHRDSILRVTIEGKAHLDKKAVKIVYQTPDDEAVEGSNEPGYLYFTAKDSTPGIKFSDFIKEENYKINVVPSPEEFRLKREEGVQINLRGEGFLDGEAHVHIEESSLWCKGDILHNMELSFPTHGFTATFTINDSDDHYLLKPHDYVQNEDDPTNKDSSPKQGLNTASFHTQKWLIRGHGYALALKKSDARSIGVEKPKKKT